MKKSIEFPMRSPIKCGSAEAEKRIYKMLTDKIGTRWLIAIQPNEADNIYVEGKKNSDGFGGRILDFTLENGEVVSLKAPWHTNGDDLFNHTGYDIRDKHLTQGICALNIKYQGFKPNLYSNILHYDEEAVVGEYERVEKIAQELANKLNKKVYYSFKSSGGSSSHYKKPERNKK